MEKLDNFEWIALNCGLKFSLLKGDAGKEILLVYNERVKTKFSNHLSVFNVLGNSNLKDVFGGSNIQGNILLNELLQEEGIRTATPSDIELILNENKLDFMKNYYTDVAVLLNGKGEINSTNAGKLVSQVYDINKDTEFPVVIPLDSLRLIKKDGSKYNPLEIEFNENPEIISAPQLIYEGETSKRFNHSNKNGIPLIEPHGNRQVYIRKDKGLFRSCLLHNSDIAYNYSNLEATESDKGIIILVKDK